MNTTGNINLAKKLREQAAALNAIADEISPPAQPPEPPVQFSPVAEAIKLPDRLPPDPVVKIDVSGKNPH